MTFPTIECIKSAPYLHQKSANSALNMMFFNALVLMLLAKFVCSYGINFL